MACSGVSFGMTVTEEALPQNRASFRYFPVFVWEGLRVLKNHGCLKTASPRDGKLCGAGRRERKHAEKRNGPVNSTSMTPHSRDRDSHSRLQLRLRMKKFHTGRQGYLEGPQLSTKRKTKRKDTSALSYNLLNSPEIQRAGD